ncbi:MAG TPA: (d)CMP kinase [Phycisphaerales bacterium]|nr:(d)CMP kinase [Phycisphaerales bacterium]
MSGAAAPASEVDSIGRGIIPMHSSSNVRGLIVTIDGPAGTGKSSVARDLAAELKLEFLDTGAMYRAATALALDRGADLSDEEAVAELVRQSDMRFDWASDPPTLYVFDRAMTARLRDADVTRTVSPVSQLAAVRRVLVQMQRRIGEIHPRLVTEGRDQGSVVFHDADVKIFLDAAASVRAKRRADQLRAAGQHADEAAIERELIERDRRDSTRAVGPLVCPPGAIRVDTSGLTQPQVVAELARLVRRETGEG